VPCGARTPIFPASPETRRPASAPSLRPHLLVLALYLAWFLLLFSQFPASGRLPGNIDTWYAIAFTNSYLNEVREAFGIESYGSFLYPVEHPHSYGESSIGLAIVPMLLRALGLGDIAAYYLFLSLVFTGTAFSAYLVATLYLPRRAPAVLAGFVAASSNFMLSTIDSPHTTFFGIAFLAFYFFKLWLDSGRRRHLCASAILAGIQTWFSAYVFLLLGVALAVLVAANLRQIAGRPGGLRGIALHVAMTAALASPFFAWYFSHLQGFYDWRSQAVLFAEFNSLDVQDFFNPMPGNLIYPEGHRFDHEDAVALQARLGRSDPFFSTEEFQLLIGAAPEAGEESMWVASRRRAFIGVTPLLLALLGAWGREPGRRELLALLAVAVVLALGPVDVFGGRVVPMPLYLLYEHVPLFHMFRIPGRAFALGLLALGVLAARGLDGLVEKLAPSARGALLAASIASCLVVLAENVPVPMRSFEAARWAEPPAELVSFFSSRPEAVILDLPSGIGYGLAGSAKDLNVFNRELIYMNWQTRHGATIVNGVNGYIPDERIAIQKLISRLPAPEAVEGLALTGVTHIVFHEDLALPGEERLLPALRSSPRLEPLVDSEGTVIFRIRS